MSSKPALATYPDPASQKTQTAKEEKASSVLVVKIFLSPTALLLASIGLPLAILIFNPKLGKFRKHLHELLSGS